MFSRDSIRILAAVASLGLAAASFAAPVPVLAQGQDDPGQGTDGQQEPAADNPFGIEDELIGVSFEGFRDSAAPSSSDTGVFINQIGSGNGAEVSQSTNTSHARITQDGADNFVGLEQSESGRHYAEIAQDGDDNVLNASQSGSGDTALRFAQTGEFNTATIVQSDSGNSFTAAEVIQQGTNNEISLLQNGSDNQARLSQSGDGNAMTANQLGSGNRLEWTQNGSGLSDLSITQSGSQTMLISQTNGGG
jgi:hypothetical protein